jgi:5'-nucleotidase
LNVNFPPGTDWPIRTTRQGKRVYTEGVEFRLDPRGREYVWIGGPGAVHPPHGGSDTEAFDQGVVGVTPLVLDLYCPQQRQVTEDIVSWRQQ